MYEGLSYHLRFANIQRYFNKILVLEPQKSLQASEIFLKNQLSNEDLQRERGEIIVTNILFCREFTEKSQGKLSSNRGFTDLHATHSVKSSVLVRKFVKIER